MCSVCASNTRFYALLFAALLLLSGCGEEGTPESRLRAAIDDIAGAIEAGDIDQVADHIVRHYSDQRHSDRRQALVTLRWYLRQHRNLHLFTLVRELSIDDAGETARSVVLVATAAVPLQSVETVLSLQADLYRFEVEWVADGGEWLVTASRWRRADLTTL